MFGRLGNRFAHMGQIATVAGSWLHINRTLIGLNCLQTFGYGFDNGGTDVTVLPDARLDVIRGAGFDFLRLAVDPAKLCADDGASNVVTTQLDADIALVITGINRRLARGLKVMVDMHVIGAPTVAGYGTNDFIDGLAGTKWTRLKFVTARLAAAISAQCSPIKVCLELFNEPAAKFWYDTAGGPSYQTYIEDMFAAVRAVMPSHMIVVEGSQGALDGIASGDPAEGMVNLTPSHFDANTAFAWHPYEPLSVTLQGEAGFFGDVSNLVFPADPADWDTTAQAAIAAIIAGVGTDAAKVALIAAVTSTSTFLAGFIVATVADGSLTDAQKVSRFQEFVTFAFSFSFPTYFGVSPSAGPKQDVAWMLSRYQIAGAWADNAGVSKRRLFVSEFGVNQTIDGTIAATDATVTACLQAHRDAAFSVGIGCLTLHELQGSGFRAQATSSPWAFRAPVLQGLRLA